MDIAYLSDGKRSPQNLAHQTDRRSLLLCENLARGMRYWLDEQVYKTQNVFPACGKLNRADSTVQLGRRQSAHAFLPGAIVALP